MKTKDPRILRAQLELLENVLGWCFIYAFFTAIVVGLCPSVLIVLYFVFATWLCFLELITEVGKYRLVIRYLPRRRSR